MALALCHLLNYAGTLAGKYNVGSLAWFCLALIQPFCCRPGVCLVWPTLCLSGVGG